MLAGCFACGNSAVLQPTAVSNAFFVVHTRPDVDQLSFESDFLNAWVQPCSNADYFRTLCVRYVLAPDATLEFAGTSADAVDLLRNRRETIQLRPIDFDITVRQTGSGSIRPGVRDRFLATKQFSMPGSRLNAGIFERPLDQAVYELQLPDVIVNGQRRHFPAFRIASAYRHQCDIVPLQ